MTEKKLKLKEIIVAFALLFCCLVSSMFGVVTNIASADATIYSNVLVDLFKDDNFEPDDYPVNDDDYSLQVINVAESSSDELFIYVYNPSAFTKSIRATSINISTTDIENPKYKNYKLEYLNSYEVFSKYRVQNFMLSEEDIRYYAISSIMRAYDEELDGKTQNGQTISEMANKVAKQWEVHTVGGRVLYNCTEIEEITITAKLVGMIRYTDGIKWLDINKNYTDSHFVAFSTDRKIDKLLEVDLEYYTQAYKNNITGEHTEPPQRVEDTIKHDGVQGETSPGIFMKKRTWKRIQDTKTFLATETITDKESETKIAGMDWVLRFYESDYSTPNETTVIFGGLITMISAAVNGTNGTYVSDVTLLRLKFETEGTTYNLGVIDNKQTGNKDPIGGDGDESLLDIIKTMFENMDETIKTLVIIVGALVGLAVVIFVIWLAWNLLSFIFGLFKKR